MDLAEPTKVKGDLFERLTQLYLLTHPEYRTTLKAVWRLEEVPPRLRNKLHLPGPDEGIDLIAETRRGEYWAVQCKYRRAKGRALGYAELATFSSLAFVTCRHVSLGIVAHTAAKPIRKRKLLGNTVEIGLERWLDLRPEDWAAIQALLLGKVLKPRSKRPRPHQKKAIAASKRHFVNDTKERGRLIMPCGTGKSLAAFWIAEAAGAHSILVAVPSLILLNRSLVDWTREYLAKGIMPDWLCVCSDESVGRNEHDEFIAKAYDTGIPTTSDEGEIASFLRRRWGSRKVIFTTYQSSPKLAAAARKARFRFDFAVLDEAHKTVGVKSKQFATLLFDENIRIGKRLFMTATERVLREKNDDVLSMDDIPTFGERFFLLTFKDAIDQEIISDYRIITVCVSDDRIESLIRENRLIDAGKEQDFPFEAQQLAAGVALKRTYRRRRVKHAISFHRSIRAADDFRVQQDTLDTNRALGPKASNMHISSKKSAGERADLLRNFAGEKRALLTNARCLTEGVDVPAIDCVVFADPKQSTIDIVQAAGRALRRSEGKTFGYILLPLVVPTGMTFDEFADTTEFRQVARTIAALSTQDERIAEQFRVITRGKKRSGKVVEIESDVKAGLNLSLHEFTQSVNARIWDRVGRANWRPFEEARAYARALGFASEKEWRAYSRSEERPPDIPSSPNLAYLGKGWVSWGDWLGTETIATYQRVFRPFKETRADVRALGLKNAKEWEAFAKSDERPPDIPSNPNLEYHDKGWKGLGDWLGTGRIHKGIWRPFKEARTDVRSLGLKSQREWRAYCKSGSRPKDIPSAPDRIYRVEGWAGYGDWLGTGRTRNWRPFKEARAYARGLGFTGADQWRAFARSEDRPPDIPYNPDRTYRDKGWVDWGDWLGTGTIATWQRKYRPFDEARVYARALGLKNVREWEAFAQSEERPVDIPYSPARTYRDEGWVSWGDWLGTDQKPAKKRRSR